MATYIFDGSTDLSVASFNPAADQVAFTNVDTADIASISEIDTSVTLSLTNGTVMTLGGVTLATLTPTNLQAGTGSDVLFAFGNGSDETLSGSVVFGRNGDDAITVAFAPGAPADSSGALILGNRGDDNIDGGGYDGARIFGGKGNDTITNFGDGSVVVGGRDADNISVDAAHGGGTFVIYGGNGLADATDGNDTISVALTDTGTATIFGNAGVDTLTVTGTGSATIYGGQGEDVINAALNSGTVVGGLAADQITVATSGTNAAVDVYGGNGTADPTDGADTISVTVTTGARANVFGNGGGDTISVSGAGAATIYGGQGGDTINVGTGGGAHTLIGGLGTDIYNLADAAAATASSIVTIIGFAADEDAILFGGTPVATVSTVNLASVADFSALASNESSTAGQVTVVNVAGGDLAGSYALYDGQVVEITGYTGTIDAGSFAPASV